MERHSIMIASHLTRSVDLIVEEKERVAAAELFLLASKQANLASSFQFSVIPLIDDPRLCQLH